MIKVLFLVPDFYPNSTGFSNASQGLLRSIAKYGSDVYETYVYTNVDLGDNDEFPFANKVFRFPYKKHFLENRFTFKYFFRNRYNTIKKIIKENNIDVIFLETNTFPYIQNQLVKDFGSKVIVRIHSTADTEVPVFEKNYVTRKQVYDFMHDVHNIVSTSNYYIDFVKHNFLGDNVYDVWNNKSYGLLYNTVYVDKKNVSPVNENRFLTMGKMSDNGLTQKGMLDLIRAIFYLKTDASLPDDFKLTIVGTGKQLPTIREYIGKLDLENYIIIVESASHEEVLKMIAESKGIILLSRYEGQSMFITESIAMGKPIIISNNNGMQDMLCDGNNGFSVRTGDVIDAASKIKKMINLPEEELDNMGNFSSSIFLKRYSEEAVYKQFSNILKIMC